MIAFVEDSTEFIYISSLLETIICKNDSSSAEEYVNFNNIFIRHNFYDFDIIKTKDFYYKLIASLPGSEFFFYTFSPDPLYYYYTNFGVYPILKFDNDVLPINVLNLLHKSPELSKADSIIDICDIVLIFTKKCDWCMYFDRNTEEGLFLSIREDASNFIDYFKGIVT